MSRWNLGLCGCVRSIAIVRKGLKYRVDDQRLIRKDQSTAPRTLRQCLPATFRRGSNGRPRDSGLADVFAYIENGLRDRSDRSDRPLWQRKLSMARDLLTVILRVRGVRGREQRDEGERTGFAEVTNVTTCGKKGKYVR